MASDPLYGKITAEEFLAMDFGTDAKFELVDGVIHMMTGGTEPHAWVQLNLTSWLRNKLRGSKCRPYGPEMGIQVTPTDVRYPDVSIFCTPRPPDYRDLRALPEPAAVIEVISPSTAQFDQGRKLAEYKALSSIQAIGYIDPVNLLVRTVTRTESGWLESFFAAQDLDLGLLGIVIPHTEIFAPD